MEPLPERDNSRVRPMSDTSIELEESGTNYPKDPSVFLVSGDEDMSVETQNGVQGESGESNLGEVRPKKETCAGLLKTLLNVEYYIGLCPFRISEEGKITGHCINKIVFVALNFLALIQNVILIRYFLFALHKKYSGDQLVWYLAIGTTLFIFLLQMSYSIMMWSQRNDFVKLLKLMTRSAVVVAHVEKKTWLFVAARLASIAVTAASVFGGLNILVMDNAYSMWEILERYEIDVIIAFTDIHTAGDTDMTNGSVGANGTMGFLESMLDGTDPDAETIILGSCAMCLDFLNQLFQSCPYDLLLLVAVIIWVHMKRVHVSNEEETTQEQAQASLQLHEELFNISDQANKLIKPFLPILVMTSAVMTSHWMYLVFLGSWYRVAFLTVKLSKLFFTFWLATWTAGKEEEYLAWFASDHAEEILKLDSSRYSRKVRRMDMTPIGVGTDIFYMNTKFIVSFFSIVLSHFTIMIQSESPQGSNSCQ